MSLPTTVIGAYPKPDSLALPDWFDRAHDGPDTDDPTGRWRQAMERLGDDAERVIRAGIAQVIRDQIDCGIDIPTDGEVRRENYIHYHCRQLDGFDFGHLVERVLRNGAYRARLPAITGPVSSRGAFLADEWRIAQSFSDRPLKVTMPGPMTITDTNADRYYNDDARLGADLADALNTEVRALAEAGCRHIQIDEPLFARKPRQALDYGIENLERALRDCPAGIEKTVHICCGYPDRLDREDYPKADPQAYFDLAVALDRSSVDAVSLEDAHRHNDLELLERYPNTKIVLGVVAIARSRLESVDEVERRLRQALKHIDADRLLAAPDCGLGFFSRDQAMAKLKTLAAAAARLG